MKYRLFLDNFETVNKFYNYQNEEKEVKRIMEPFIDICNPIILKDGGKKRSVFSLYEIDAVTSGYKDKDEFIARAKKAKEQVLTEKERLSNCLSLVLFNNKRAKNIDLVFHDLLIYKASCNLRRKNMYKKKGEKPLIDKLPEIIDFVNYLKEIVDDPNMRDYILDPRSIDYLTGKDKKSLNMKTFNDVKKYNTNNNGIYDDKTVKVGLRTLLTDYLRLKKIYNNRSDICASTVEVERELDDINKALINYFRSDYNRIREAVIWENNLLNVLCNKINGNIKFDLREKLVGQIRYIEKSKRIRNNESVEEDYIENYNPTNHYQYRFDFTNPKIQEYFDIGGVEEVLKYVDIDEIYSNMDDAKKLGLVPDNNKRL